MRGPEIIGVIFVLVIGAIVFLSLLFRHLQWRRETLHQERVKYLERGMTPPETDSGPTDRQRVLHNSFWIAFWTGGFVPVAAIIAGAITSSEMRFSSGGARSEALFFLWGGVVAIAVAGVASAAAIMVSTSRRSEDHQPSDTRGYQPPRA
jgi:hypothetical protein